MLFPRSVAGSPLRHSINPKNVNQLLSQQKVKKYLPIKKESLAQLLFLVPSLAMPRLYNSSCYKSYYY